MSQRNRLSWTADDIRACLSQLEENTVTMNMATARIEALEAALREIASLRYSNTSAANIARAALDKDAGK